MDGISQLLIEVIANHDISLKSGYIEGILIETTLFCGISISHLEGTHYERIRVKDTVIQRLVRLEESRSLLVTLIVNLVNSKVAKCNFRKSDEKIFHVNQTIKF